MSVVSLVVALGLGTGLAEGAARTASPPAPPDPAGRKSAVDSGVRRAHDDLEQSSAALRQAAAALDAVGARLPTARQAAAEARGTLA
ncbi:MAG TPA: hypothetical protein VKP64_13080, partial [Mycobacteriales bacterium]|nr:hypothetical protein [Mycobacteriales bacterium]